MPNLFTRVLRTLAILAGVAALHAGVARAAPPHVLLIVVDDLGWMDLCCQGNDRLNTLRLDAFAKQGVRFTDTYAASPVCSPIYAMREDRVEAVWFLAARRESRT
jgi:uncharacterized sulfatase